MFGAHPKLDNGDKINVVLYQDHFSNADNPVITGATFVVLDNYPPKQFIGECYQKDTGDWYYIADNDGVNLLGDVAYYL